LVLIGTVVSEENFVSKLSNQKQECLYPPYLSDQNKMRTFCRGQHHSCKFGYNWQISFRQEDWNV